MNPKPTNYFACWSNFEGYRTESAYTGAEAIEKVRAISPDVVLLDLMLPDIDGYDVCRQLKAPGPVTPFP